jgi:hypothetical protein
VGGRQLEYLVHGNGIVPANQRNLSQFADIASQVVNERIVIVDKYNQERSRVEGLGSNAEVG